MTLAYYLDDSVQKISQGGTDTTFTLDAAGRRKAQVTTPATGAAKTLTRHYTDDSDNPSWVDTGNGEYERYTDSVSGSLGAMIDQTGQANIALLDPNGNTVTSIDIPAANGTNTPATSITDWSTYSEYGETTTGGTTGTNASSGVLGYGWLGGAQRATTPDTAGLTLMGARVYNNQRGLFTSPDPEYGGNETLYGYPNDPLNNEDADGQWGIPKWVKKAASKVSSGAKKVGRATKKAVKKVAKTAWKHRGTIAAASTLFCSACAVAYAGYSAYRAYRSGGRWSGVAYAAVGAVGPGKVLKGFTAAGVRGAKYSGRTYRSRAEAQRAARRYANKHPHSCQYRGVCSSGTHFHVDKYNSRGHLIHVRHYYW